MLGVVPLRPALGVGAVLVADAGAIEVLDRLDWRSTALVAIARFTVGAILGITLSDLVRLLGTAPLAPA